MSARATVRCCSATGRSCSSTRPEGNQANKITAYLKQHGVTAIDYLVCTHAHADHCGGMKAVIAAFPVRTLYSSVTSSSNGAFQRVMRAAETANLAIHRAERGRHVLPRQRDRDRPRPAKALQRRQ
ncbi:MAG: MBL fold metallo-hydrolase [Oscillospiraceae bacterium]